MNRRYLNFGNSKVRVWQVKGKWKLKEDQSGKRENP